MPELERMIFPLAFSDLCRIYDYAISDSAGEELPALPVYLHDVVTALRDQVWNARTEAQLHRMDDAPAWLAAQQTLKERSVP